MKASLCSSDAHYRANSNYAPHILEGEPRVWTEPTSYASLCSLVAPCSTEQTELQAHRLGPGRRPVAWLLLYHVLMLIFLGPQTRIAAFGAQLLPKACLVPPLHEGVLQADAQLVHRCALLVVQVAVVEHQLCIL